MGVDDVSFFRSFSPSGGSTNSTIISSRNQPERRGSDVTIRQRRNARTTRNGLSHKTEMTHDGRKLRCTSVICMTIGRNFAHLIVGG